MCLFNLLKSLTIFRENKELIEKKILQVIEKNSIYIRGLLYCFSFIYFSNKLNLFKINKSYRR